METLSRDPLYLDKVGLYLDKVGTGYMGGKTYPYVAPLHFKAFSKTYEHSVSEAMGRSGIMSELAQGLDTVFWALISSGNDFSLISVL